MTQPRASRLRQPRLHPREVARVQRLLGVAADGEAGPETAAAVAAWRRSRAAGGAGELRPEDVRRIVADVPLRAVTLMERWAAAGVAEDPPGSNRVPALVRLAGRLEVAPAYRDMGYPWCSFAVFLAALASGGLAAALGLRERAFNPIYTPAVLTAARSGGLGLRVVAAGAAFRGDLAIFDWDFAHGDPAEHVGRLVAGPSEGRVRTVDGNSGGDGLIALRTREIGSVRAFARDA